MKIVRWKLSRILHSIVCNFFTAWHVWLDAGLDGNQPIKFVNLVVPRPCETEPHKKDILKAHFAYQVILYTKFKLSFFLLIIISCELVCSWNESFSWSKSYRFQKHDAAFSSRTNKLSPPGKVYILWLFF